ncbi:sulfotransferase family protein [Gammaproteobacteria bacterium]|nr:sulfotransferase family protein [Gammaproteobacteria bacterium]
MDSETLLQIKRNGFWFVDIPRTSSSSIKVELGKAYGPPYGKSNLIESEFSTKQTIPDHIPAIYMRKHLGLESWNGLYTFTFVRNPWDRMVSMYFYRLLKGHYSEDLTFKEYILQLKSLADGHQSVLFNYYAFYLGCCDYIFDGETSLVSYIGRYENRENDIQKISSYLKCADLGKVCLQRSTNKSMHYSYYYDDETEDIVRRLYRKDIERFDYKFESRQ